VRYELDGSGDEARFVMHKSERVRGCG